MTPQILDRLQSLRREMGCPELTFTVNDQGVEMRAGDELLFTNMGLPKALTDPEPEPEPEPEPVRTPWPTSSELADRRRAERVDL